MSASWHRFASSRHVLGKLLVVAINLLRVPHCLPVRPEPPGSIAGSGLGTQPVGHDRNIGSEHQLIAVARFDFAVRTTGAYPANQFNQGCTGIGADSSLVAVANNCPLAAYSAADWTACSRKRPQSQARLGVGRLAEFKRHVAGLVGEIGKESSASRPRLRPDSSAFSTRTSKTRSQYSW